MAIEDLDNFAIKYINFYSELPGTKHRDSVDEKHDYLDGINPSTTDEHVDSSSSQGISDQQVNQLAQDQAKDAGVNRPDRSNQDITLFSENL